MESYVTMDSNVSTDSDVDKKIAREAKPPSHNGCMQKSYFQGDYF